MLKNELEEITALVQLICRDFREELYSDEDELTITVTAFCHQLKCAWIHAAFTENDENCLRRYFNFHLQGIRDISDTLYCFQNNTNKGRSQADFLFVNDELLNLINFQQKFFNSFFDVDLKAPLYFQEIFILTNLDHVQVVNNLIRKADIDEDLMQCIIEYIGSMSLQNTTFSFRSLLYLKIFLDEIQTLAFHHRLTSDALSEKLIEFNFNNLSFFLYLIKCIRVNTMALNEAQKVQYLRQKSLLVNVPHANDLILDPDWPSIRPMLYEWLTEELKDAKEGLLLREAKLKRGKLSLNLSVAHLACLIRLFYEEQHFNASSLVEIFRFTAEHYQTKRQLSISEKSLSKEFYSIGQVTAAVVRDMLLKMVNRINRSFFPVLIVISAIIDFL